MSDCHTVRPSSPATGPSSPAAGGRVLRSMGPSSPVDWAEFSGGRVLRGAEFSGADFSAGPTSPDTDVRAWIIHYITPYFSDWSLLFDDINLSIMNHHIPICVHKTPTGNEAKYAKSLYNKAGVQNQHAVGYTNYVYKYFIYCSFIEIETLKPTLHEWLY